MTATIESQKTGTAIRPFTFEATDVDLADLKARIAATRWPGKETVADATQGVQLATIKELARYWSNEYDWQDAQDRLNAVPNFLTEIDGLDIHFIHARSKHEDALPLIVTHGWPGSIIEQLKLVEPLTNPTAHGGSESDAFHVVIPSIPGYGFSARPTSPGWGPERIALAWTELMRRLGYSRFVAQGGDWGSVITEVLAAQEPPELVGIHVNMPGVIPPEVDGPAFAGGPVPEGLSDEEQRAAEQVTEAYRHIGYGILMGDHPQTLTGMSDSPVGLAAFLIDHDVKSADLIARAFAGESTGLTRDDVLDNVTLFWLTNTLVSSGQLYWENKHTFFGPKGVNVPTAVSVFPDELYEAPRSWSEQAFPNLVHYNRVAKGGHFAAWEQPEIFVDEVRAGFRSLR